MKFGLTLFLLFHTASWVQAELVRLPNLGVRPAGMGNAFLAISDDNNALWYNPAGLARIKSTHFNLLDTSFAVDSLDTLSRITNAVSTGNTTDLLRSDKQFMKLGVRPTLTMPYFSVALYNHFNSFIELSNLETLSGSVDLYTFNDTGVAAGFGIPVLPSVSIGATTRVFGRTGIDSKITTLDLLAKTGALTQEALMQAAFSEILEIAGVGWGVGVDLGIMGSIPLAKGYPRWTLAAVLNDALGTYFRTLPGYTAPTTVNPTLHLGTALEYDLGKRKGKFNLALDYRNCFESTLLIKQLNLGVEYRHPRFGLRAGFSQGYPTAGVSLEFPPHTRVHLATYGVELGASNWSIFQRWFMLQFIIGFNPN
jgi:hypothetical protein